jgi:hypothetical protein
VEKMPEKMMMTNQCFSELCDAVTKINILLRVLDEHHIDEKMCKNELEFYFTLILLAREQAEVLKAVVNNVEEKQVAVARDIGNQVDIA